MIIPIPHRSFLNVMAFGLSGLNPHNNCLNLTPNCHRVMHLNARLNPIKNPMDDDRSSDDIADVYNAPPTSPPNAESGILQLVQSHFAAQALLTIVQLGIPDVLAIAPDGKSAALSLDEIITKTKHPNTSINRQALFRCLRLLCTVGVIQETTKNIDGSVESAFLLTETGQLLQTKTSSGGSPSESMSHFVLHWMEQPLWSAWSHLPDYVAGNSIVDKALPPFDRANGISASDYYLENAMSCTHRNAVARYASSKEIDSILDAINENTDRSNVDKSLARSSPLNASFLSGKNIVDIGGGYGDFMAALKNSIPSVGHCYCLDLSDVIADAVSANSINTDLNKENLVDLVAGDMFDSSTIPTPCDVIFTKHVLCDFSDSEVVQALQSFHKVLSSSDSKEGKVVIMDAVLPNEEDLNGKWNAAVSFDVLLMLTGRRGERSRLEWSNLAKKAGFVLDDVLSTSSVTVDLAVLSLK